MTDISAIRSRRLDELTKFGMTLAWSSDSEVRKQLSEYSIKQFGVSHMTLRNYVETAFLRLKDIHREI